MIPYKLKQSILTDSPLAYYEDENCTIAIKDVKSGYIICAFKDKSTKKAECCICKILDNGLTIYIEINRRKYYINSFKGVCNGKK